MALERNTILADNLRESLNLYQRSLVWAMTASAAFFVLSVTLGDPVVPSVPVLYGKLSGPSAWFIALGLFFVLGILSGSALSNAELVLSELQRPTAGSPGPPLEPDVLNAILLYPSLATNANGWIRVGTVMFSPIIVLIAFGLELRRESASTSVDVFSWLRLIGLVALIAAPYLNTARRLWRPIGSRSDKPLPVNARTHL